MVGYKVHSIFRELPRKTLKEYKKLKKENLIKIIRSQFGNYDKLRGICQKLYLENDFLKRNNKHRRKLR